MLILYLQNFSFNLAFFYYICTPILFIMRIAIFGSKRQTADTIYEVMQKLHKYCTDVYVHSRFAEYLQATFAVSVPEDRVFDVLPEQCDFVFSIGGDGTFLRTVVASNGTGIPLVGINTGHLGFLSDISTDNLEETLQELADKSFRIEERSQLQVAINKSVLPDYSLALNEVAILKQDTASMLTIHARINEEYLTSYKADGLLIATPTGSTAYALSVGAPIMTPTASNFILAPIAPHSLNMRPLIIEDDCKLNFEIESRNRHYLVSLDGRSRILQVKDTVTIQKATDTLKLVKRIGHTFYGTLRQKLMWGIDPRLNKTQL
jgi:NAD+ kinase